ncbi:MAG TPA: hypothetical protein VKT18_08635, partial [Acidimicrobiales bacterium]|nr:hypothetical protein [Acidimicrobiales bacterium]
AVDSGDVSASGWLEGRVREETGHGQLEYAIHGLTVTRKGDRGRASARGTLKLRSGSVLDGAVDLTGSDLTLEDLRGVVAGVHVRAATLVGTARRAVIRRGDAPDVNVDVDLPNTEVTDLRDLSTLLHAGVRVTGGRAVVSGKASVRVRARDLTARGSAHAEGLSLEVGEVTARAGVDARVAAVRWNWGDHQARIEHPEVIVRDLTVAETLGEAGIATAPVLSARSRRIGLGPGGTSGIVAVDLPRMEIDNLSLLTRRMTLSGAVVVERGEASASVHGDLDLFSLAASGDASVTVPALRVKVGRDLYAGNLTARLRARVVPGQAGTMLLSGSDVAFASAGAPSSDAWWAWAWLGDATVNVTGAGHFRGD